MARLNSSLLHSSNLCTKLLTPWRFKIYCRFVFCTLAAQRWLVQGISILCFVVFPTQATDYTFSDGSSTFPAGCSITSTGNYSCGVLTLLVGDTIIIGDTKPVTITFSGAFTTAAANLINPGGTASDLNIVMIGVLTLGDDTVFNANVTATAAVNLGIGSTLSGYIDTVSTNSTANVTGIITLGANSSVGSHIMTDAGAVTVGNSGSVEGGVSTIAGVVTLGLSTAVSGSISTVLGAVNIGGSSTVGGGITTEAGVVTLTTNIKIGGDIRTIGGGITIGNGSSTCGSAISTGAGVVTLANNVEIGGDISTVAGAITVGNGSTVGGDITPSGAGVVTLTGVLVGGKVETGAGAINLTSSRVRGTVSATGAGVVTLTSSVAEDTTLVVPAAHACPITSQFHHIQIEYDGAGSTCAIKNFKVKACVDAACNTLVDSGDVTAILEPFGSTINIGVSGWATLSVTPSVAGYTSLRATSVSPTPASSSTVCLNTTTNLTDCSLLVLACASGGFACLENGVNSSWDAAARKPLYTKLVNTNFIVDIVALKSNGTLETNYVAIGGIAKAVMFELVDGTGDDACIDRTAIGPSISQTLSFSDSDLGRKTASMRVTEAYTNLRCRLTDINQVPAAVNCSTDSFAVRPLGFTVNSSNANADNNGQNTTASPEIKAGISFNLTADSSTVGYNGTPLIDTSAVEAHSGAISNGALSGEFNAADTASGIASGSRFTYSDVGYFRMGAHALTDSSFTMVDQSDNDCTDDFSNTLNGGRYGCKITNIADTSYFGRFYPDHFDVVVAPGCNTGGFTYSAQPFTVMVTAKNGFVPSTITSNYDGSTLPNFAQTVTFSDINNVAEGFLSPTIINANAFSMGVANPIPAFTFNNVATAPIIIKLHAVDTDYVSSSGYESEATNTIRSGRIRLLNAYGSEILDLPMTMRAEYWQNATNGWQTNTADTCTDATLSFSAILPTDITSNTCVLDTGSSSGNSSKGCSITASSNKQYSEAGVNDFTGNFNLWLKAPGSGNSGSLVVTAMVPPWLRYNWTGLKANPKGLASFGVSKSDSSKIVHRQERY